MYFGHHPKGHPLFPVSKTKGSSPKSKKTARQLKPDQIELQNKTQKAKVFGLMNNPYQTNKHGGEPLKKGKYKRE